MSRGWTVAVIGLGSRGLSVVERIVTLADQAGAAYGPIQVELIDPRGDGAGIHTTDQPDYLLLNTTASQVSMFPDAATVGDAAGAPGPSLYEWVTARGLRIAPDGFTVGTEGRPVRPTDFLPRRVLGEYLGWFLTELQRRCPAHVQLRLHRAEAVDLADGPDGRMRVRLATGAEFPVDYAFLTTGYTDNRPSTPGPGGHRRIDAPYPLPAQLARVAPGETVAIGGFGLSAMDIMSTLTVGRGGRFIHNGDECQYLPSGREPRMLFYSRSGLPCRARPAVARFDHRYDPVVFTPAAIDVLRAQRGPLDFTADVLPLVLAEMRVAYRRCELRHADPAAAQRLEQALATAADLAEVTALLDQLDHQRGRFDALAAFEGAAGMLCADRSAYQKWLIEVVKADLVEGRRGLTSSPVKAALDVLRALRDTFRHAVDYGGLTTASLDDFHARIVPMLNRAVVGPQYERHVELLTLLADGIAEAPFGPAPEVRWEAASERWLISSTRLDTPYHTEVDWLCVANLSLPSVADSASPLLAGLHRRGWIRPFRPDNPHLPGLDIDSAHHPVRADGTPESRLWVLGPLCEGATYYTNLVPSPGVFSRPIHDAHRCVAAMFAQATA